MNIRFQAFGDFCNVDAAPSIGVEDGEPYYVRAFIADNVRDTIRRMVGIVPVVYMDIVAVFFQQRPHIINTDRGNTDVVFVNSLVEEIGINQ